MSACGLLVAIQEAIVVAAFVHILETAFNVMNN